MIVVMDGGIIQNIVGNTVDVIVKDYDIEGIPEDQLSKDDDGTAYYEIIWEAEK